MEIKKDDGKLLKNVIAFIKSKCEIKCTGEEMFAVFSMMERQLQISEMLTQELADEEKRKTEAETPEPKIEETTKKKK